MQKNLARGPAEAFDPFEYLNYGSILPVGVSRPWEDLTRESI